MKKAFFVTEMSKVGYQGGAFGNIFLAESMISKELSQMKKKYSEFDWNSGTLDELYSSVEVPDLIITSSLTKPYKHAIEEKYPSSKIEQFEKNN